MKKSTLILKQALVGLLPTIYFLSVWHKIPETVPVHYNINNQADGFGSKFEMLGIILFMFAIAIGVSFFVLNNDKFDPKQSFAKNQPLVVKITWATIIFISAISFLIVYETEHYAPGSDNIFSIKYIVALMALFFTALGNYMNSIKQNHFVGVRTPWTLEDEENWRLTHYFTSKLWFFYGLAMFILVLVVPSEYAIYFALFGPLPFAAIPFLYSFYIFRQKQKGRQVKVE